MVSIAMQSRLSTTLAWGIEALVVFLALFSAWPFGSVHAYFQWILFTATACLLAFWAGRAVLEGRPIWCSCVITMALASICFLAMLQIVPLNEPAVRLLSPAAAVLNENSSAGDGTHDASRLWTFSLAPGATRRYLLQLIAVVTVFAAVRSNLREPGCLRRLAWLGAANGVMLTVVALGQMVSSPPDTVFWSLQTDGSVFGPFICRNHFAFYLNLCLGLTAGLLLGTRSFLPEASGRTAPWREMLRDSRVLWLASALGIMLAGLIACLSRGGVLGLCAGGIVGMIILRSSGTARLRAGTVVLITAILMLAWLGVDRVSRRWEKIWEDNARGEARVAVWARTIPLTARFPILGSGLGTFGLVEPSTRTPGDPFDIFHEHAHNDFLELWIEGGPAQLVLACVVIGLILRKGIQAGRRHGSTENGRLAIGAVVGFTAVVVQSFVDFGLHIPAVALFTAIVAALLANLADVGEPEPAAQNPALVRWPAVSLQVAALLTVALLLFRHGRAEEQAERLRLASLTAPEHRRVDYLRAAIAQAPDRADLRVALSDALVKRWLRKRQSTEVRCACLLVASPPFANLPAALFVGHPAPLGWSDENDLQEAWRHVAAARDLSPLNLDALERTSRLAGIFGDADANDRALARLGQLSPSEPFPWLWAGQKARERKDRAELCRNWRNALLATNTVLPQIIQAVPGDLSADELLEKVLPADPALILKALDDLSAQKPDAVDEKHYLRAALEALANRLEAQDHLLKARIHARLQEVPEACAAYEFALAGRPHAAERMEFCEYLLQVGLYARARQEIAVHLDQEPQNHSARALQQAIYRKIAETH